jgi:hypothetical protein
METTNQSTIVQNMFKLLKFTFVVVPVVAGLDKFLNLLAEWQLYLPSGISEALPFSAGTFMAIVGVIEIIAGVIVFLKPKIGGLIVAAWLVLIALVLIIGGDYDVAVRDLVMAIAAFAMANLAKVNE